MKSMRFLRMKSLFKLNSGTTPKVIAIVAVVVVAVSGMLYVNFRIIMNAKRSIISVVDNDVKAVAKNAALGRSLGKLFAETNWLILTFTQQEAFLKERKVQLIKAVRKIDPLFSSIGSDEFRSAFQAYALDIETVLNHCEKLDDTLQDIRRLDREIERDLSGLNEVLSDQEITLMAEGGGRYLVENVRKMLPIYRQYGTQASNRIFRLNHAYLATEAVAAEDKQNLLKILDEFDTALTDLTISGAGFADMGRRLRRLVASYRKGFQAYYVLMEQFRPQFASMNRSQGRIMALSEKIDAGVGANSEAIKRDLSKSITSFAFLSTGIFVLFNGLSAALCFFVVKMFRISRLAANLQKALYEIKTLRGILPICSYCKKIRDDSGYWNQLESYLKKHSEIDFSHSICPECAKTYFPDMDIYHDSPSQPKPEKR